MKFSLGCPTTNENAFSNPDAFVHKRTATADQVKVANHAIVGKVFHMRIRAITGFLTCVILAACGGGGAGSSTTPSVPVPGGGGAPSAVPSATAAPTVAPSPTATPTLISTSSPAYLPLGIGTTWTFDTGKIVDTGLWGLSCSCPYNANPNNEEELQVFNNTTGYQGSIFVTTQQCSFGPVTCYSVIGTSKQPAGPNCSSCVTVTDDAAYPDGYPFMDDKPVNGQSWNDNEFASALSNVGAIQLLPGNQEAQNVAADTFSSASLPSNLVWEFAKGIGFVSIQYNGTTALLTSFTPPAARTISSLTVRGTVGAQRGNLDLSLLKALIK